MKRLNAIIALLAQPGERKIGTSVVILRKAGLQPIEISRILGKPRSHITSILAKAKRSASKKGGAYQ